jgi:hypothetical protein
MDDDSNCEAGVIQFPDDKTMGEHTAQGLYDITPSEEFAKINEVTGTITLLSEKPTRLRTDSLERTAVWDNDSMTSPQMVVQLRATSYKGLMTVLEKTGSFILRGHQA